MADFVTASHMTGEINYFPVTEYYLCEHLSDSSPSEIQKSMELGTNGYIFRNKNDFWQAPLVQDIWMPGYSEITRAIAQPKPTSLILPF